AAVRREDAVLGVVVGGVVLQTPSAFPSMSQGTFSVGGWPSRQRQRMPLMTFLSSGVASPADASGAIARSAISPTEGRRTPRGRNPGPAPWSSPYSECLQASATKTVRWSPCASRTADRRREELLQRPVERRRLRQVHHVPGALDDDELRPRERRREHAARRER